MKLNIVNKENWSKEVLQSDKPVLVDFSADWCTYCRRLEPVLERMAELLEGKVKLVKLDIDTDREISDKFNIDTIPSLIVFNKGNAADVAINPASQNLIVEYLKNNGAL